MWSELFWEKEMVWESHASYDSLSPDSSLSPDASPTAESSSLPDGSSSPERFAERGIPSEPDESVCTVGTTRRLWKKEACPWPTEDRGGVPFGRRTTTSHDSLEIEWAR